MAAAAVTGGDVRILDTRAEHITPVIPVFEQGVPQRFELIGAGWGHGVGLCQIGAAVMQVLYKYHLLTHLFHEHPSGQILLS